MRPLRLAALSVSLACAGPQLPGGPIFSPRSWPQTDQQLPSGLRVVVQEDHSVSLVTVAAIYGTGATSDPEEAGGLAHLVEHLTFRARHDDASRLDRLKRAGASFDAETGPDTTLYYSVGYRDMLEDLLREEVGRLAAPLEGVTDDDVKIERLVALNERRQRQGGTTGPAVLGMLQERLYPPTHPLGRPVMGSEASMARATLPLAQAFAGRHYRPENCTLVIAGDVAPARVKELMRSWPAALLDPGGPAIAHRPPLMLGEKPAPPAAATTKLIRITGPVKRSQLWLAWALPGATPDGEAQMLTIAAALQAATHRYRTRAGVIPLADGSILTLRRPLGRVEDPYPARDNLLRLVASDEAVRLAMTATPIVRSTARANLLRELADPQVHALELARHLAATGRSNVYADTMGRVGVMTMDAVARTMRSYLRPERAAAVVVDPEGEVIGEETAESEAHDLAGSVGGSVEGMGPADVLRVARSPGLGTLPRFTLANGLTVAVIERPAAALARVDLFIPGGSATEVPYAELLSDISLNGCRPSVPLEDVAGSGHVSHGPFASHVAVVVPDGNLENALAAVSDEARCREISYPYLQALKAAVRRDRDGADSTGARAARFFWQALYPAHAYGRAGSDVAAIDHLEAGEASEYLRAHFRPNDALSVVVSALPAASLRPLIEEFLGGWPRVTNVPLRAAPRLPPPIPNRRVVQLFPDTRRTQVQLRLGCRLPVDAAALPALDVVEQLVDEHANELRESWGATYRLAVDVGYFPGSAHLTIQGAVDANQVGTALARLLDLMAADAREGPDQRAFTIARWEVARRFNLRFATGDGLANALLFAKQQGWAPAEWDRYPARLATVAPDRVQFLMKACAGHEVVIITGDVPSITAQLKARGLE